MRTLIIQHDDNTGPGVMRDAIAAAGEIVMWHPVQDNERPELEGIDAVFIMGGHANPTEDFHPWLAGELDLIEEALDIGTPILGICLGG
jgi:GMP synthase (glutamine-hydrolysing)